MANVYLYTFQTVAAVQYIHRNVGVELSVTAPLVQCTFNTCVGVGVIPCGGVRMWACVYATTRDGVNPCRVCLPIFTAYPSECRSEPPVTVPFAQCALNIYMDLCVCGRVGVRVYGPTWRWGFPAAFAYRSCSINF